jgi:signal transduction histidine kinase
VFAEHVAPQVANAQLYQRERARVGELLEVYRLKADFVSAMVNELAPPLRAMVGSVENLRELSLNGAQRDAVLVMMDREGTRLLRLVDRLGRQGRHGSRGAAVGEDHVDIGLLARAVAAELARRGRPVELRIEPDCVVLGDEEIVQPVLMNLVDNAYRHGSPPVTILVDRLDDRVVVSVEDRGPGIPPERRESVFAGIPGAGEQGPRAGAGLSIVRGVVTALRGDVWVEDVPGGGAAFRISLPSDIPAWGDRGVDPEAPPVTTIPEAYDSESEVPFHDRSLAASELSALAIDDDDDGSWQRLPTPAPPAVPAPATPAPAAAPVPTAPAPPATPAPPPMPGA